MKDKKGLDVIWNMRNQAISKTVIAVTGVVVLATLGLYVFSKRNNGGSVAQKTYANGTYGISFEYPETYDLTETSFSEEERESGIVVTLIDKGTRIPENGEGPTAITVEMYDGVAAPAGRSRLRTWILNSTSSNFRLARQSTPGETRIGSKEAYIYTWDGLYQGTSVVTEHNGNIIMFSVTYDGETDLKKREDFTKMMETVRFETATSTATTTER